MTLALFVRRRSRFVSSLCSGFLGSLIFYLILRASDHISISTDHPKINYRQRPECTCSRRALPTLSSRQLVNEHHPSFCSHYTSQRGGHQRVIAISLFGPKEVQKFQIHRSLHYLRLLIEDLNQIYSDRFILRVYHDDSINATNTICPIECAHPNVDFCDMNHKTFIPPKIWRFIPAGDPLVDISKSIDRHDHAYRLIYLVMSRDLDSAFTLRERAAVNAWLSSNKSFHVMRDHPKHRLHILGGLWGFRPAFNRPLSRILLQKIHNRELIAEYIGRADQTFLTVHVWPLAKSSLLVHDSFHCQDGFGYRGQPFPTKRPSANETNCFVGCMRPCCGHGKMPFGPCPKECRPKKHLDWTYC